MLAAIAFCGGCASNQPIAVDLYTPDPAVQDALRKPAGAMLAIGEFDSAREQFDSVSCLDKPIGLPLTDTIAEYIGDGVEAELVAAGRYDGNSDLVITGTVTDMRLRLDGKLGSGAIGATWILGLRLRSSNGRSVSVTTGSAYRTGFEVANCYQVAKSFMPMVQKLLREAITNPGFAALTKIERELQGSPQPRPAAIPTPRTQEHRWIGETN